MYLINNEKTIEYTKNPESKYNVNSWRPPGDLVEKKILK